ncbi:2Fe-2S iron-sulfur cluster-binding protein [Raineyella sp. W15-4]|uniref:2Fe-2S iron-sulfur cluster-binding protein n=1 Tax=Raineyella sp. W15-4 TaxID=3081651 RepID=UPI002952C4B2|nr:2Fe-2S iron-sulfur cluster-binding protein [Raineyella sp. W15-4]WOQ15657.1 2Fe-2S iron-sulfur cluster-binding protein [Raineyella sp. W15-4]
MTKVTVHPTGEVVEVRDGETIMGAFYRTGYAMRIGCKRGGCGFCKIDVHDGAFSYERPVSAEVVTPEEAARGVCLPCRAVPSQDMVIEFRENSLRLVNPLMRHMLSTQAVPAHQPRISTPV